MSEALSSHWTGLNKKLLATFWQVNRSGKRVSDVEIQAPLIGGNIEFALAWQSSFENSGAESKAPALMAMLQSGHLQPVLAALNVGGETGNADVPSTTAGEFLAEAEGRTGITILNSTQIFTGMSPYKITGSLLFRAWMNPQTEVMQPVNQFIEWSLPIELSKDGTLINALKAVKGESSFVDALLPSKAPTMVAMKYKDRVYKPLVIEAQTRPLDSPMLSDGNDVETLLPITIASLTAIDSKMWREISKSQRSI